MGHLRGAKLGVSARLALGIALFVATNGVGYAQGCALCYTQAAKASHRMIRGLRTGILFLIVPPMLVSVGITVLAYKKRNRTNDKSDSRNCRNDWLQT
jgi:hypothetical protein